MTDKISRSSSGAPRADLAGAIAAFDRLSRHALEGDGQSSFVGHFLAESARLLREVEAGRIVDETEWLESLEAVRLASEFARRNHDSDFS